jgi:flagellar motor switch protein FliG
MSLVMRHKKKGGFKKLVFSLETTAFDKRKLILDAMRKEDPDFIAEVEGSIFNFEEFLGINDLIIAEVVGAMKKEMRMLALALFKCDEELIKKFTKNMRPNEHFEFRDFTSAFTKVLEREQMGARFRVIVKSRELEAARKIVLKKISPKYAHEE